MTLTASEPPPAAAVDIRPLHERIAGLALDRDGSFEDANESLYRARLTDGLPVVPPTAARIDAMLVAASLHADDVLDTLMPSFTAPTLWDVAASAVMAGCEAPYLPVIVAALRAVADPAFNLLGIQTTTGAAAPLLIVNGPVAAQLDINAGPNCMGQGWRANATIGRAVRLVLQNVGLGIPGSGDMATQGQPGKYSWCIAENEAKSPWPPLHVTRGFDAAASAVTAVGAVGNVEVVLSVSAPEELVTTLAHSMTLAGNLGAHGTFGGGQALVLLPPESARFLDGHGWDRARLQEALFEEARMPLDWLNERAAERLRGDATADAVTVARSPQDILVVVTGGVGIKATFVPTWGGGTEAVTRPVELL